MALRLLHACEVHAVDKPLLIYDGECKFCQAWIARWRARTGDRIDYAPLHPTLLRRLGVPLSAALRSVQLVTPDGKRYEGAAAVFRALGEAPGLRLVTRVARVLPARWIAEWIYRRVARHRGLAARIDRVLFGGSTAPPTTAHVRSLFMRALGGVYLIAFRSLHRQVLGLYGKRGIAPIHAYLDAVRAVLSMRAGDTASGARDASLLRVRECVRHVPSVFWLGASDTALVLACLVGQACGALSILGIAPRLTALASWAMYLSFVSTGRDFLRFQWDALLLETGLGAAIVAPPRSGSTASIESPPWTAVAVMRSLVFRLYFESGLCKLASGDPTWRDCTACCYHYATQPLPTPLGWYAHQAPRSVQRLSTFVALALELVAPVLIFAPRRMRRLAFGALASLQLVIAATGNYGFFNLLTLVDSLWILDDETVGRALRMRMPPRRRAPWWRRLAVAVAALPLLVLAGAEVVTRLRRRIGMPRLVARLHQAAAPLHAVNPYGLFAVMTTKRPEIIIEGSLDGQAWREYELRYKPGDIYKPPSFVAPHQPRLDWQMWFAALGPPPPWFASLLARLLEGSPDVIALFAKNPFPEQPPTYVRALLYEYRMTDRDTRRRTGAWWHRELVGLYFPPVSRARDPAA